MLADSIIICFIETNAENNKHAMLNGLIDNNGEKNGNCKLTDDEVNEIRRLYVPYSKEFSYRKLADRFKVSHVHIIGIIKNRYRAK